MIVFRLSKQKYCYDLSGRGAYLAGGRWNSKGVAIVYTGESRALCLTEVAVHIPYGTIPNDYFLVTLEIPEDSIEEITPGKLPKDWSSIPPPASTKKIGDEFVNAGRSLVLKVPSATVPGDFNFLINPLHKNITQVKITEDPIPFPFDPRLFKTQ